MPIVTQTMAILTTQVHLQPIPCPHLNRTKFHVQPPKKFLYSRTRRPDRRLVSRSEGPPENDHGTRKVSERLYAAIKDRNIRELAGEELHTRRCVPLIFESFLEKKHALVVLSSLAAFIASHTKFVIEPKTHGGSDVGIKWNFEWKTPDLPLGEVCSLYTAHAYNGKIYVSNKKAHIWPLPNVELFRLKMEEIIIPMIEKIVQKSALKGKTRADFLYCFLSLLIIALSIILWKNLCV